MKLAIVGAGYSGISAAVHALEKGTYSRVTLFDSGRRSLAWSSEWTSDSPHLLCNLPVANLRVSDSYTPSFLEWSGLEESSFPPRHKFGAYLDYVLRNLENDVEVVRRQVHSLEELQEFDRVALCCGAPAQQHVVSPGCLPAFPPPLIPPASTVVVLGSGLTAVDIIKHVCATSDATVHVVSRRGRFPAIWHMDDTRTRVPLPEETDATGLERIVLEEVGYDLAMLRDDVDGVEELRRNVAKEGLPVVPGGRYSAQEFLRVWREEPEEKRLQWLQSTGRRVFQNYSNAMPPESATELLRLIDEGRVQVHSGGSLEGLDHTHVIDCRGVDFSLSETDNPLFRTLQEHAHPLGGLRGEPLAPRVVVIGDAAKGDRYLTSGLGFLLAMVREHI